MPTNTSVNAAPSDHQGALLLAALAHSTHRVPGATGRTYGIMVRRGWVKEYTAAGKLAGPARLLGYTGFTHFRLTDRGIIAAQRFRNAQELRALAADMPAESFAVYRPEFDPGKTLRETTAVFISTRPDETGRVRAIFDGGRGDVRVPLRALEPIADRRMVPADGAPTDTWTITDRHGAELAQVHADSYPAARTAAEQLPAVAAAIQQDGRLRCRRLRTSETTTAIGAPFRWWSVLDRAGNELTRVHATDPESARTALSPAVRKAGSRAGGLIFA
ncbi:hypothetical protein AB0O57_29605 [Streptomyces sp. NPDC091201]|uniref:hypothetical protein n=1 Tax=Streptomyces sp. NPDC091201 TaxID=3155190 RepID=UPI0034294AAF